VCAKTGAGPASSRTLRTRARRSPPASAAIRVDALRDALEELEQKLGIADETTTVASKARMRP
jgi:hypothetical protein